MAITIERQVPERGDRGVAAAPAGQCCCCCCCCLHSVGGVIGALSARARPNDSAQIPSSAIDGPTREPRPSASGLYWAIVAILSGLFSMYFLAFEGRGDQVAAAAFVIAICLPGVQLAASIVAAIAIAGSQRVDRDVRLRHLGRITLRAFLGALIGIVIMIPMFSKC